MGKPMLRTWGMSFDLSKMEPGQVGMAQGGRKLQGRGLNKEIPEGFFYPCEQEIEKLIDARVQALVEEKVREAIAKVKGFEIGDLKFGLWLEPDDDWRLLNGSILQRSDFPDFWEWANNWDNGVETWGDLFGIDGGSVTLPNESDFIRIANGDRRVGTFQHDAFQGHFHKFKKRNSAPGGASVNPANSTNNPDPFVESFSLVTEPVSDGLSGTPRTAKETRPSNRAYGGAIRVKLSIF
ncbi:MAG: hypothetical protein AAGA60_10700 [Cyanobacteria bacterium P01_E01_bin.42]